MSPVGGLNTTLIPDYKRQPGNLGRLDRVYRFIMELVSFSPLLFKLVMISVLCKRPLILHYLTNDHIFCIYFCPKLFSPFFTYLEVPFISIEDIVKLAVGGLVLW